MFLISSEKAILETLHGTISWTLVMSVLLHKAALYSLLQSSPLPSKIPYQTTSLKSPAGLLQPFFFMTTSTDL